MKKIVVYKDGSYKLFEANEPTYEYENDSDYLTTIDPPHDTPNSWISVKERLREAFNAGVNWERFDRNRTHDQENGINFEEWLELKVSPPNTKPEDTNK